MAIHIDQNKASKTSRNVLIAAAIILSFFGSYAYAKSARNVDVANGTGSTSAQYATTGASAGGAGGGGCCGGGAGAGAGAAGAATAGSALPAGSAGSASSGGGCCGSGGPQKAVKGSTTVAGNVQKVTIDLTTGSYSPNEITAKAGVPLELDFKGPASSCNGYVQSQQLGFSQDVSNGGTIKVGALQPGTYTFACSMNMYTATIVVK
jgi:hypothetical protein